MDFISDIKKQLTASLQVKTIFKIQPVQQHFDPHRGFCQAYIVQCGHSISPFTHDQSACEEQLPSHK